MIPIAIRFVNGFVDNVDKSMNIFIRIMNKW
jgi:hypothetical protein